MRKISFLFIIISLFASCQGGKKEQLKQTIQNLDDSLRTEVKNAMQSDSYKMDTSLYRKSIAANINFYKSYPNDKFSDTALQRIAALYRQLNEADLAVNWRDTLLTKFPNTAHKEGLLELQMNYYDYNHYNPEKIKYYIGKLLNIKDLSNEKRKQFEFRLQHIDLTFDQLIELQSKLANQKSDSTKTNGN